MQHPDPPGRHKAPHMDPHKEARPDKAGGHAHAEHGREQNPPGAVSPPFIPSPPDRILPQLELLESSSTPFPISTSTNEIQAPISTGRNATSTPLGTQMALAPQTTPHFQSNLTNGVVPLATISGLRTTSAVIASPSGASSNTTSTSARAPVTSTGASVTSMADSLRPFVDIISSSTPGTLTLSTSTGAQTTSITTLVTASLSSLSASASLNVNAAAMDRSDPPNSANIFDRGNELFPLAIVIVVVGTLFLMSAAGIVFLRLSGCTKKRKLRSAIPSIYEGGEKGMWDPAFHSASHDTAPAAKSGRGIASTLRASTRAVHTYVPPVPPRPPPAAPLGWEIVTPPTVEREDAYDGAFFPTPPAASAAAPASNRFLLPPSADVHQGGGARVLNPFHSPHDSLDVPQDADPIGSPVPSFATVRQATDRDILPCPKATRGTPSDPLDVPIRGEGYGYITLNRSSSTSTSSSGSSYTSRGRTAASIKSTSSGSDSFTSNYLAMYPMPSPPGTSKGGEGAELERLRSAGVRNPQRSGTGRSGRSGSGESGSKLAKNAGWKMDI